MTFLEQHAVPTPQTWVLRDRQAALAVAEEQLGGGPESVSHFGLQGEGLTGKSGFFWFAQVRCFLFAAVCQCGEVITRCCP
ncbi:MAG: hypothetical protein H0A75_00885 [Candidatus Methanofishera endochildressiae]|uniref:Uncharacterized protein n=1 Tax=Candidatus Methanofishera endochildressiae TaxID=2738884 RepID=A0A7Z0MMU9_9GAMM|nr:hypothetical protein [Candidatus Methanofishera endochildressiae]